MEKWVLKYRIYFYIFLICILISLVFLSLKSLKTYRNAGEAVTNNIYPEKEITFLEAYHLGFEKSKEFDSNPELMFLNSVDDGQISGQDGKKANWQGVFSLTKKRSQLVFVIEKGRLKEYELTDASDELTIKDEWIKTDSTKIIKIAKLNFQLQPSPKTHPFSHGYHFRIIRDQKNIFLAVNGLIEGKEAEIYFNPKTGRYMGRTESTN